MTIEQSSRAAFLARYVTLFEHSPWVAERAWDKRPFANEIDLHAALLDVVNTAAATEQLRLIRAHPELADKVAQAGGLTAASAVEQHSAGLDQLSLEEFARFHHFNAAYRARFDFPFIICVRPHDKHQILEAMHSRLTNDQDQEIREALRQIGEIARLRLAALPEPPK